MSPRSSCLPQPATPQIPTLSLHDALPISNDERHDGRLDRYAALTLQRQGVGLGAALIDASDLVDDAGGVEEPLGDRKSTRLNSSHRCISYAVFCLKKKTKIRHYQRAQQQQ